MYSTSDWTCTFPKINGTSRTADTAEACAIIKDIFHAGAVFAAFAKRNFDNTNARSSVDIYNSTSGDLVHVVEDQETSEWGSFKRVCMSQDCSELFIMTSNARVQVHSLAPSREGEPVRTLELGPLAPSFGSHYHIAISPDSRLLATSPFDDNGGTVFVYDAQGQASPTSIATKVAALSGSVEQDALARFLDEVLFSETPSLPTIAVQNFLMHSADIQPTEAQIEYAASAIVRTHLAPLVHAAVEESREAAGGVHPYSVQPGIAICRSWLKLYFDEPIEDPQPSGTALAEYYLRVFVDPAVELIKTTWSTHVQKIQASGSAEKYGEVAAEVLLADLGVYNSVSAKLEGEVGYHELLAYAKVTAADFKRQHQINGQRDAQPGGVTKSSSIKLQTRALEMRNAFYALVHDVGKKTKLGVNVGTLKQTARLGEKEFLRGDVSTVCDVLRAQLVAHPSKPRATDEPAMMFRGVKYLLEHPDVEVVDFKDRMNEPSAGGWRDITVLFRIKGTNGHICETQVALNKMLLARTGMDAHDAYNVSRHYGGLYTHITGKSMFEVVRQAESKRRADGSELAAMRRTLESRDQEIARLKAAIAALKRQAPAPAAPQFNTVTTTVTAASACGKTTTTTTTTAGAAGGGSQSGCALIGVL